MFVFVMMMTRERSARTFVCVVGLLVLLSLPEARGLEWKYCKGDWEAKIQNATVIPDPARAGQELNVLINGEIGKLRSALLCSALLLCLLTKPLTFDLLG